MSSAHDIIKRVAGQTDRILLFHSGSGKDSIVMLDLCAPYFKEVVCVFMYVVPNLQSQLRYVRFAEAMYSNVRFIQCPHFNVSSYIKAGYLGCTQNTKQKLLSLSDITEQARKATGIEWAFYGMKEADSLNRRVFLRTYDDGIYWKGKKCYPLHLYKHKDIVKYIKDKGLITNQDYGKKTSSGESVDSPEYLAWLRENFPSDLQQVYRYYPEAERILFEYDNYIQQQQQTE